MQSDHDLIVQLVTDMRWVRENLDNHLKHHWMVTLSVLGALLAAGGMFLIVLIKYSH